MPTKFRCFNHDLGRGLHRLDRDTLRVMLSDEKPEPTAKRKSDVVEILPGGGYPTGGLRVERSGYTNENGLGCLVGDDVVFIGRGEPTSQFRFAVLYNATSLGGPLIGYWDRGASISLADGDEFALRFRDREILTVA